MRLIHIQDENGSLELSLCDFIGSEDERPSYAILSHRWRDGEVLFTDMTSNRSVTQAKKGYHKLEACCKVALQHRLQYVWCDTCCIDKSSSGILDGSVVAVPLLTSRVAELSEAINSMYEFYAKADLCIAYLDDVEDPQADSYLNNAIWFSRGWTLQELIAPRELRFYSRGWEELGTKAALSHHITTACGIGEMVLSEPSSLSSICVSEKMSWAARRTTTRPEDRAYSLMVRDPCVCYHCLPLTCPIAIKGLFGVNMPPLYVLLSLNDMTPLTMLLAGTVRVLKTRFGGSNSRYSRPQPTILCSPGMLILPVMIW